MIYKKTYIMNLLKSVFINYSNDYFGRMGGAGRYGRFMAWHPAGLVLMLAVGVKPPESTDWAKEYDGSAHLPFEIWRKTDRMPYQVYEKLKGVSIDRQTFDEFVLYISEDLAKLHPNELSSFNSFLEEKKFYFEQHFARTAPLAKG